MLKIYCLLIGQAYLYCKSRIYKIGQYTLSNLKVYDLF